MNQKVIPVILSCDERYYAYTLVTMQSAIAHSNPKCQYAFFVLEQGISDDDKALALHMVENYAHVSLQFIKMDEYINQYGKELFYSPAHFSPAAYYRLFVGELFPQYDKILYLDSDMVVLEDVGALFDMDMGDSLIAATRDLINIYHFQTEARDLDYCKNVLKMREPTNYLQSGVCLLNLKSMRAFDFTRKCFERLAEIKCPKLVDQDILNSVCEGRIFYLPPEWNYYWHADFEFSGRLDKIKPAGLFEEFAAVRMKPAVIHYASHIKVWHHPEMALAPYWWEYARQTPFYEKLLLDLLEYRGGIKKLSQFQIFKYTILSKITFGKKRKKYKKKLMRAK